MTKKKIELELDEVMGKVYKDALDIIDTTKVYEPNPQVKRRYVVDTRPSLDLFAYFIKQFQYDIEEGHLFDIIWTLAKVEKARENNFVSSIASDFSYRYTISPSCPDESSYAKYIDISKQLNLYEV